jgi:hypothetical protein
MSSFYTYLSNLCIFLSLKITIWLSVTFSNSLCIETNINKVVCICWYHYCIYSDNARLLNLIIVK